MAVAAHPLRAFLASLVSGSACAIPEDLRALARSVLGRRASPSNLDDLLGDLLLRLVEATRHGRAGSASALLKLSEAGLRAALRHRLRQVLAESVPDARLRKQLRAMVKAVLSHDLPVPPACAPTSLQQGERLSTARVRDAVAWSLAQSQAPARTVPALAGHLQGLYFGAAQAAPPAAVQESFEAELLRGLDAPRLLEGLHRHLGEQLAHAAALRAGGAELRAIAEQQQVAVSTAHQRVATAVQRIRRHARRRKVGPTSLEPLLLALGR